MKHDLTNSDENALSELVRDSDYLKFNIGTGSEAFFKIISETYIFTEIQFKQLVDDLIYDLNISEGE